jgi:hypothetical protein
MRSLAIGRLARGLVGAPASLFSLRMSVGVVGRLVGVVLVGPRRGSSARSAGHVPYKKTKKYYFVSIWDEIALRTSYSFSYSCLPLSVR